MRDWRTGELIEVFAVFKKLQTGKLYYRDKYGVLSSLPEEIVSSKIKEVRDKQERILDELHTQSQYFRTLEGTAPDEDLKLYCGKLKHVGDLCFLEDQLKDLEM